MAHSLYSAKPISKQVMDPKSGRRVSPVNAGHGNKYREVGLGPGCPAAAVFLGIAGAERVYGY